MPFDEQLADRVRTRLAAGRHISEKKLFGGLGFFHRGNMVVCAWKTWLIVRLGHDAAEQSMLLPYVKPFDVTGKPMKGWVMIDREGLTNDEDLAMWIDQALEFVKTLKAK